MVTKQMIWMLLMKISAIHLQVILPNQRMKPHNMLILRIINLLIAVILMTLISRTEFKRMKSNISMKKSLMMMMNVKLLKRM